MGRIESKEEGVGQGKDGGGGEKETINGDVRKEGKRKMKGMENEVNGKGSRNGRSMQGRYKWSRSEEGRKWNA